MVWLVKGRNYKKANTDSTMLKSRQLVVDLCPQASQSDRAHRETTTAQILKKSKRFRQE